MPNYDLSNPGAISAAAELACARATQEPDQDSYNAAWLHGYASALANVADALEPRQELIADLSLDTAAHTVKQGDREITLSAKEYALLEYLMRNAGTVLSRERIEDHIWNADYEGGTNVVDVYISYLRKKIDGGHENKLIHTVRGSGYVLREGT